MNNLPKELIKADLIRCIAEESAKARAMRECSAWAVTTYAIKKLLAGAQEASNNVIVLSQKLAKMLDEESA